jgi:hypothetical protein
MLTANHVFLRVKDTRQDVFIARSMQFIAVAHRRGSGFSSVVNVEACAFGQAKAGLSAASGEDRF